MKLIESLAAMVVLMFFATAHGSDSKEAGFDVRELTSIDGTAFEVVSRTHGHSVRVDGTPLFNVTNTAFISAKDDFESNHPQIEARLFDCSKRARCLEVWHAAKGEGARDPKWIDNDRVRVTLVRNINGAIVPIAYSCSIKKRACESVAAKPNKN